MIRRILTVALAVAAMYAAVLGTAAPAQAPTPAATEAATATPITSPAPTAVPTQAPTVVPTQTPAQTSTPTPFPSPVKTTVPTATPTATATGTPTATASPTATATATPAPKKTKPKKPNANSGSGSIVTCGGKVVTGSLSTSARECQAASEEAHNHAGAAPQSPTVVAAPKLTNADGTPAPTNPSYSLATPGAARVGVPNFFINKFRIPPFLLPIYQAAGMQYGIRWEVLAAINEIETDYGRNLNISSAGAVGWMQFMPATWDMYGVDANGDGVKDPFNPVDAIFAAARYLRAAGGDRDIRRAVFAYNHANWYVDSVLMRAQIIGGLPGDLVGSLTGLTQGRFPVHAKSTYAGQLSKRGNKVTQGNAAMVVQGDGARRGIKIFSRDKAPVIAVNDGKVVKLGKDKRLGRFVMLQDVYGNTYTYAHLGEVEKTYPAPRDRSSRGGRREGDGKKKGKTKGKKKGAFKAAKPIVAPRAAVPAPPAKERLFAHPRRASALAAGAATQLADNTPVATAWRQAQAAPLGFNARDFRPAPLKKGARVIGGTILGHLGVRTPKVAPHLLFEIRPAGRGAPRIDPKPILDGWKLLESTAIYRAKGKNPFFGQDAENLTIGQIVMLSKEQLIRRVLSDSRIQIYPCGRADIRSGQVDRRVLATMLYLDEEGLKPTITALKCGHSLMTTSGNISEHSTGTAMDIGAINGIIIRPSTQGPGSITDVTIQALLKLQGTMKPHQIISLMTFRGADNTLALPDHDDHIHVGWRPLYGQNREAARQINAVLKPDQWIKLIARLSSIDNPTVPRQPSRFAIKVRRPASRAHRGD